jgi:hypothetical protein
MVLNLFEVYASLYLNCSLTKSRAVSGRKYCGGADMWLYPPRDRDHRGAFVHLGFGNLGNVRAVRIPTFKEH